MTIAFLLWGLPEYAIEEIGGSAEVTWPPGLQWDATPWDWLCQWGPQNFTDWIRENGDPLDPIDPWLWGYPILRQSNINPGYDEDVSSKMQPETLKRLFDFFESFVAGPWQLTTSTRLHRHKFGIELLPGSTPRSIKKCRETVILPRQLAPARRFFVVDLDDDCWENGITPACRSHIRYSRVEIDILDCIVFN